jgi:hypothetical protein
VAWFNEQNVNRVGSALQYILDAGEIEPGTPPGYQLCKRLYSDHPLGRKIAEAPVSMAQSQKREISVGGSPIEEELKEQFWKEWSRIDADKYIFNHHTLSRVYGISSLAIKVKGEAWDAPLDLKKLYKKEITFSNFDPLNTSGSLVLNQNPNDFDFLQPSAGIRVSGQDYHKSRCSVKLNGQPIYLEFTPAAFGFVGRSVFQSIVYPMKSFIQSMVTDDMVTLKAGVIVAKIKQVGNFVDGIIERIWRGKAEKVKEAQTYNVITVSPEESIETLNMQNLDGAYGMARTNILKNIATGADMHAHLLENETLVSGFGEGTEDAKAIAASIDRIRIEMDPTYRFMDAIVMHRAWSEEWFDGLDDTLKEALQGKSYTVLFQEWVEGFKAQWPSLLQEPESEKAKADDVRLKALIALLQVVPPMLDPENKAAFVMGAVDNLNDMKLLFPTPFELDAQALSDFLEEQKDQQAEMQEAALEKPKPEGATT